MKKFNLKKYAKDVIIETTEKALAKMHEKAMEEITEKQLAKDRVDEKDKTTEGLLDEKREDSKQELTESLLNKSTSKLYNHRNEKASAGDINKLEEQRLKNKPVEKESYNQASEIPKEMKSWQKEGMDKMPSDSKNKFKLAQKKTK